VELKKRGGDACEGDGHILIARPGATKERSEMSLDWERNGGTSIREGEGCPKYSLKIASNSRVQPDSYLRAQGSSMVLPGGGGERGLEEKKKKKKKEKKNSSSRGVKKESESGRDGQILGLEEVPSLNFVADRENSPLPQRSTQLAY